MRFTCFDCVLSEPIDVFCGLAISNPEGVSVWTKVESICVSVAVCLHFVLYLLSINDNNYFLHQSYYFSSIAIKITNNGFDCKYHCVSVVYSSFSYSSSLVTYLVYDETSY